MRWKSKFLPVCALAHLNLTQALQTPSLLAEGVWRITLFYQKFHWFVSEGRKFSARAFGARGSCRPIVVGDESEETRSVARYDAGSWKLAHCDLRSPKVFRLCLLYYLVLLSCRVDRRVQNFAFLSALCVLVKIIPSKTTLCLTVAWFASQNLEISPLVPSVLACTVNPIGQWWHAETRISECVTMRDFEKNASNYISRLFATTLEPQSRLLHARATKFRFSPKSGIHLQ